MKQYLLLLSIFIPFVSLAQLDSSKKSKIEQFASENSTLLRTDRWQLAKLKGVVVSKTTVTNIEKEKSESAIEITDKPNFWSAYAGIYSFSQITIDFDDLPELTKALKYIQTNILSLECKSDCPTVSYAYETNSGIIFSVVKNVGAYGTAWHLFLTKHYSTLSGIEIERKDLDDLIEVIDKEIANYKPDN